MGINNSLSYLEYKGRLWLCEEIFFFFFFTDSSMTYYDWKPMVGEEGSGVFFNFSEPESSSTHSFNKYSLSTNYVPGTEASIYSN